MGTTIHKALGQNTAQNAELFPKFREGDLKRESPEGKAKEKEQRKSPSLEDG